MAEQEWQEFVVRHNVKFLSIIVEANKTMTQAAAALNQCAVAKTKGGPGGNVIIYFDANLFGESQTAPHARKPPLQAAIIEKMWKAVCEVRKQQDQSGLLPPHDVLMVLNAGRKGDSFLNCFGMGKTRKEHDKTRTPKKVKRKRLSLQ